MAKHIRKVGVLGAGVMGSGIAAHVAGAGYPVLLLDMWEHAFYLDYVNVKADYVKAFWNIVNWADVSARFEKAREKTSGLLLLS